MRPVRRLALATCGRAPDDEPPATPSLPAASETAPAPAPSPRAG